MQIKSFIVLRIQQLQFTEQAHNFQRAEAWVQAVSVTLKSRNLTLLETFLYLSKIQDGKNRVRLLKLLHLFYMF